MRRTKAWLRSRACLERPRPLLRQSMLGICQKINGLYRGVIREKDEDEDEVINGSGGWKMSSRAAE